jgi:transcriptional regulator with XRE-family HTH domain
VLSGAWLRERREALGLSQSETARLAGIQQGHLSRLEAGIHGCSPKTEAKLAKALKFRV